MIEDNYDCYDLWTPQTSGRELARRAFDGLAHRWEQFIAPRRHPDHWLVPERVHGIAVLTVLDSQTERYRWVASWDTALALIWRRSWLLPWRWFAYLPVGRKAVASDRHILWNTGEYYTEAATGRLLNSNEFGQMLVACLNENLDQDFESWFALAATEHDQLNRVD